MATRSIVLPCPSGSLQNGSTSSFCSSLSKLKIVWLVQKFVESHSKWPEGKVTRLHAAEPKRRVWSVKLSKLGEGIEGDAMERGFKLRQLPPHWCVYMLTNTCTLASCPAISLAACGGRRGREGGGWFGICTCCRQRLPIFVSLSWLFFPKAGCVTTKALIHF